MTVTGSITDSFIGTGVNPHDGFFGDGDDQSAKGTSRIGALTVTGTLDAKTRFEAASLPSKVHVKKKAVTPSAQLGFIRLS